MTEVMALIYQDHIPITVFYILQKPIDACLIRFFKKAHGHDSSIEMVSLIITLPHILQRLRADDKRAGMFRPLKMFEDSCSNVALT